MTADSRDHDIVVCKWNPKPIKMLLAADRAVHVVLDSWDRQFASISPEDLARLASVHVVENFDSLPEVSGVAASLRSMGVDAPLIGSFAEFSQFGAGVLAHHLRAPNLSMELSLRSRDKRTMKQAYRDGGVPCARWLSVHDLSAPPSEEEVASTVGWPAVLKPVSGMAALGTRLVADHDALVAAGRAVDLPDEVGCQQFMLEEYVTGQEFHVDAVWDGGQEWYLAISEYFTPRMSIVPGEEGSILLDEDENAELYAQVRELHGQVNRAVGITDGATHFEFFRRPDGSLVASEVATRIGGGPAVDLVAGRDGFDLREMWAAQLGRLGRPEVAPGSGTHHRHVAAINIPPRGQGVVTAMPSAAELDADPHVISATRLVEEGEVVHGLWTLFLVLGASTRDELERVIDDARRRYVVVAAE